MIGLLEGVLAPLDAERVLVRTDGGVGYVVACSATTLRALPVAGERVELRTHLVVREDALDLYGFASPEEHALFLLLLGVQAVGPKVALAVLGDGTANVAVAIAAADVRTIQRAHGVGKRTAERIVVDLKDRMGDVVPAPPAGGPEAGDAEPAGTDAGDGPRAEALAGLVGLGFPSGEAETLLAGAQGETAAALLSDALRRSRSTS